MIAAKGPSERLALGRKFGMSMKLGLPYSMVNTVIEYEENRLLAWQTRGPGRIGSRLGGRIWRYELRPVEGGTEVTETWDISGESRASRWIVRAGAGKTRAAMEATLQRIEAIVTG